MVDAFLASGSSFLLSPQHRLRERVNSTVLLVIALLVVGARRLQHLRYVAGDALFGGFVVWPVFPAIAPW
jgi:hypothetical protein